MSADMCACGFTVYMLLYGLCDTVYENMRIEAYTLDMIIFALNAIPYSSFIINRKIKPTTSYLSWHIPMKSYHARQIFFDAGYMLIRSPVCETKKEEKTWTFFLLPSRARSLSHFNHTRAHTQTNRMHVRQYCWCLTKLNDIREMFH